MQDDFAAFDWGRADSLKRLNARMELVNITQNLGGNFDVNNP